VKPKDMAGRLQLEFIGYARKELPRRKAERKIPAL